MRLKPGSGVGFLERILSRKWKEGGADEAPSSLLQVVPENNGKPPKSI
jgi:hypothetical protein